MRRRAGGGGSPIGLGERKPVPLVRRLQLSHAGRCALLADAGICQTLLGSLDGQRQRGAGAGELHLLPAAQILTQDPVPPRLCRLTLERVPLVVDLEDDVVDAGQVLSCRLDLQLGGPAAALVFRYACRFFEQLAPFQRTCAQDLTDLALLDDRVRLDPHPGVHQQVLDVAQPADPAVDQVLALARPEQSPADLDISNEVQSVVQGAGDLTRFTGGRAVPVEHGRGSRNVGETQSDLGRCGRPAAVAAAEDDILHPLAAQAPHALLTQHPRDGIYEVALAASIRTDDGGHPGVECDLRLFGKALEAGDSQLVQAHRLVPGPLPRTQKDRSDRCTPRCACRAAGNALTRRFGLRNGDSTRRRQLPARRPDMSLRSRV